MGSFNSNEILLSDHFYIPWRMDLPVCGAKKLNQISEKVKLSNKILRKHTHTKIDLSKKGKSNTISGSNFCCDEYLLCTFLNVSMINDNKCWNSPQFAYRLCECCLTAQSIKFSYIWFASWLSKVNSGLYARLMYCIAIFICLHSILEKTSLNNTIAS